VVGIYLRHSENPFEAERELIILRDSPTDERYGSRPGDRRIPSLLSMGYILLDKPRGPTSVEVTERVRRLLGVDKAGHGGTLDLPGVIPPSPAFYQYCLEARPRPQL